MTKIIFTILFGVAFQFVFGQSELKNDFDQSVGHLKSGNYKVAVNGFSEVLAKATDVDLKKFCLIYRAFSYNGLDEFDKAIADLDKAVELDPDDLATYTDRGKTKGYINDLEGAKKDFLFVLTRDTVGDQAKAAYHYLGKISYAEKHFEQSIRYFNKLIALVPRDSDAYFTRAAAKGMISDLAGSIEDYSKAIGIDPDFAEAYANRGVAKINLLTRNGNI